MNVCIVGAGAIGGWMGVRLAQAGHAVSVLARGETLAAIRARGLTLVSDGVRSSVNVTASDDVRALPTPDLVIIAVKAPALRAAALSCAPMIGPNTLVLTAMNGVPWWFFERTDRPLAGTKLLCADADGEIARALPMANVIGCVVHASSSIAAPGEIAHKMGNRLVIGEPAGGVSPRLENLRSVFTAAGYDVEATPDIQREVWFKLWGNMTMNPISALTGATMDVLLADPLVRAFCTAAMLEAKTVGEKIGIPIPQDPEDRHVITAKLGAVRTSMLNDVLANRTIELDALLATAREIAQKVNVATPMLDALFGLTRVMARERGIYPAA